jgi:hypothetical protein|tara:strand:+ start:463 stop:1110 length:648 start_codon:yes stop_codon:yes gene_type:complete
MTITSTTKSSNYILGLAILSLIIILGLYVYTLINAWEIFGIKRLVILTMTSIFIAGPFISFIGSGKSEIDNAIIYNPKECPKFIGILIYFLIGVYLYLFLTSNSIYGSSEYYFGLAYIVINLLMPNIYSIYRLVRDRKDFVKINNGVLSYQNNNNRNEFILDNINYVEYKYKHLVIEFKDDAKNERIPLKEMNFNVRDSINLRNDIESQLKKKQD